MSAPAEPPVTGRSGDAKSSSAVRTGGLRPGATGSRRWQNAAAVPLIPESATYGPNARTAAPSGSGKTLHRSDEAFAFGERRQLGEARQHRLLPAYPAYLAEACTGRPEHLSDSGHVPNVMCTWPTGP